MKTNSSINFIIGRPPNEQDFDSMFRASDDDFDVIGIDEMTVKAQKTLPFAFGLAFLRVFHCLQYLESKSRASFFFQFGAKSCRTSPKIGPIRCARFVFAILFNTL